jgi:1-acyl-sn-glycerol-3-phosphate acyltransferase
LPFKPSLFESAVLANVPVYSLAISYRSTVTNQRTEIPAFIGEMGLFESMSNILKERHLIVDLVFLHPTGSSPENPKDRKWLALHSQDAISTQLSSNFLLM